MPGWMTGAVRSRSEAAAPFIREGMKVYRTELDLLEGALRDVQSAKQRLQDRVREMLDAKTEEDQRR